MATAVDETSLKRALGVDELRESYRLFSTTVVTQNGVGSDALVVLAAEHNIRSSLDAKGKRRKDNVHCHESPPPEAKSWFAFT